MRSLVTYTAPQPRNPVPFNTLCASIALLVLSSSASCFGQIGGSMPDITQQQTYTLLRATSRESTGANADFRKLTPGTTLTILDADGPGMISHMWFTIASPEPYHLKRIILRIYWDGETSPSVETPIGDFFGLGLGVYHTWQSAMLSVGNSNAMNSFFPMPYAHHARITITNRGKESVDSLYYNIDYRKDSHPLPPHTLYFHAQYRQAQPNHGWTTNWYANGDPIVNYKRTSTAKTTTSGSKPKDTDSTSASPCPYFKIRTAGGAKATTCSTSTEPSWHRRHRLRGLFPRRMGLWRPFSFQLYGAPIVGEEVAGERSSVYRFHLDSPIPFTQSMKASIEHGHANPRSDNFYSVAYWYQDEPHLPFPPLPSPDDLIPTLQVVGGPGNTGVNQPSTSLSPR